MGSFNHHLELAPKSQKCCYVHKLASIFWCPKWTCGNQVQIQLTEYQCFVGRILLPKVTAQWRQAMNPSWCQLMSQRHIEQEHTHKVWFNISGCLHILDKKIGDTVSTGYSFVLCLYICIHICIGSLGKYLMSWYTKRAALMALHSPVRWSRLCTHRSITWILIWILWTMSVETANG